MPSLAQTTDTLSEDQLNVFLSKEWTVATADSKAYLFKLHHNSSTRSEVCSVLITDTISVWTEAISATQFSRRWRRCNPNLSFISEESRDHSPSYLNFLPLISRAHTTGGINQAMLEVSASMSSDISFSLDYGSFKWCWDTCFIGYKQSAAVLSKHLVLPLISLGHLAFTTPENVIDLPSSGLERIIDRAAGSARRSTDTHIKNALSKPRLATALQRMTASTNFTQDLPEVLLEIVHPNLELGPNTLQGEPSQKEEQLSSLTYHRENLGSPDDAKDGSLISHKSKKADVMDIDSATESEDELPVPTVNTKSSRDSSPFRKHLEGHEDKRLASLLDNSASMKSFDPPKEYPEQKERGKSSSSDSDSESEKAPRQPPKKKARSLSSDDDTEEERKRSAEYMKSGTGPIRSSGVRQPLKRAPKRF